MRDTAEEADVFVQEVGDDRGEIAAGGVFGTEENALGGVSARFEGRVKEIERGALDDPPQDVRARSAEGEAEDDAWERRAGPADAGSRKWAEEDPAAGMLPAAFPFARKGLPA